MAAPHRVCPSCETPLPVEAGFCPSCGEATPTEISGETGTVRTPETTDTDEQEYRQRLQRALGDGYELREHVGRGGFADVYKALDIELRREVAVKVLRSDLILSHSLVERFRREAQVVANLRHPNIIPIYSVGQGEGLLYFTMPLVEGETLRAVLKREGKLPVEEANRILIEAAGALATAHESGLVHRDVKPDNIMLEGKERRVFVMDFGIAKVLASEAEGLTQTGMIIGTAQYMSPEQAAVTVISIIARTSIR